MYRLILLFILSFLSQGVVANSKYNFQSQDNLVATPYGERTIHTRWFGQNRTTSHYDNSVAFTGRYHDKETGLYYFRARYYDSEQGRFISRDPAGYIDGMGLYNGYFASHFGLDPSGEFIITGSIALGSLAFKGLAIYSTWKMGESIGKATLAGRDYIQASLDNDSCKKEKALNKLKGHGKNLAIDAALTATSLGVVKALSKFKKLGKVKNKIKGNKAPKSGPKPTPKFIPPTNPPSLPMKDIPKSWRTRQMKPTEQYPNGYWKLDKPMTDGSWQPINPSTMRPGTRAETHIPLPPNK